MKALHERGFPVPRPVDQSRHTIVMSLVDGFPLTQLARCDNPGKLFDQCMQLIVRLALHGLIHCDFNEFNLLVNDRLEITLIDFPQMVSTSHPNADEYFDRDVQCVRTYFKRKFDFDSSDYPRLKDYLLKKEVDLDLEVSASGFSKELSAEFERLAEEERKLLNENPQIADDEADDEEDEDEDDEEEKEEEEEEEGKEQGENEEEEKEDSEEESNVKTTESSITRETTSQTSTTTTAAAEGASSTTTTPAHATLTQKQISHRVKKQVSRRKGPLKGRNLNKSAQNQLARQIRKDVSKD